jgi:hypothetical protein
VGLARWTHHDVALSDDDGLVADPERRLAGLHDEHLRVGMAVDLRPGAGPRVDEDHRERNVVVRADQLVAVLRVVELVERNDSPARLRHARRLRESPRAMIAAARTIDTATTAR